MDLTQVFNQIDPVSAVAIVAMVVAVVEFLKKLFKKEWASAVYIFAAGAVGALAGLMLGTNIVYSGILGLAASGVYQLANVFGRISSTTESAATKTKAKK